MTTLSTPARRGRANRGPAGPSPWVRRAAVAVGVAVAALLLLIDVGSATASPAVLRVLDDGAPSYGRAIPIAAPGGGTFTADPGRALVTLTPAGGTAVTGPAWCVDRLRRTSVGVDRAVDLQTPADTPALAEPGMQSAGWLIAAADDLIAAAPDPGREAAAVQVAVWRLTGQAADVLAVTPDAALNARAQELRELARGMAPVTALALAGPGGTLAAGTPATVTVTATPGAVVDLAVTAGAAALSSPQVQVGPSGSATVTVTPSGAGTVIVGATARGGHLARAAHLPGARGPQDMALITPATLTAFATLVAAAPAPPAVATGVPPAPAPRVTPVPAVLRVHKTAPARVTRGRVIRYSLTVTNTGPVTARGVVVRDPLPAGTYVASMPARARLRAGAVVWDIGALAPGARVTVHLRLGTRLVAPGDLRNVATASARNARTVRARATTRILPVRVPVPRVAPAVTG